MNVFITGGTGFIGGHLIPQLITAGHKITCLVRDKKKGEYLSSQYNVQIVIGDVTDPVSLENINVENIDIVIHMAAMGHVAAATDEAFNKFVAVNEGGTKNIINIFKKSSRLKKFIHISSTAAMGFIGTAVLNEQSLPNPITPYQNSKYRSELIPLSEFERTHFPGIILRPCMVYGPGGYGEFYKFCRLMKKGIFPKVGRGQNLTPLVYVDDVINAIILAIEKGKNGETYIVASDTSIKMDYLRELIMKQIGTSAPYIFVPSSIALLGARVLEKIYGLIGKDPIVSYQNIKSTITDRTFDISKIKNELGYRVNTPFELGIKETICWYKENSKI